MLLRKKNSTLFFFFPCARMATQCMKTEEQLIEFISLTLIYKILQEDNGSSLVMCSIIILGEEKLSWLCAAGTKSKRLFDKCVYQVHLQCYFVRSVAVSVILLYAHLTWWTSLANPSGGGRIGRGGSLFESSNSSFFSPFLLIMIMMGSCASSD